MKITFFCLFILLLPFAYANAQIHVSQSAATVGAYDVYELTVAHPKSYNNNWDDVTVDVVFKGSETIHINGFFYDTSIWKVRFAPPDTGAWSYSLSFKTPDTTFTDSGSFICVPSNTKGFLKQHPSNKFRMIYADGTLFNGIGLEDCIQPLSTDPDPLDHFGFDGSFSPPAPYGSAGLKTYMNAYGDSGAQFNLFRWTTDNCSFKLYDAITTTGNTYDVKNGMYGDTLVRSLRANKIRVWLTFFGPPVFNDIDGSTPLEEAAIEKYINYVVARYGAYTDMWELFNESSATDYYYNTISAYIRSIDPYHKLISVSDERPQLASIDINSPHWYEKESEFESDARAYTMITSRKSYNKMIIFGEQGNSVQNWDILSSVRMRMRAWTSFFAEGILIFWNTSYSKNYMATSANIYLGPQERGYIRALQQFTSVADSSVSQIPLKPMNPNDVRGYGLNTAKFILGYFHHYSSHSIPITTSFNISLRKSGTVFWVNPADGSVIDTERVTFGQQILKSPAFYIDLAMRIKLDSISTFFDTGQKLRLLVYPNPTAGSFTLLGSFNGYATLQLYNISGKKIYTQNNISNDQQLDIPGLIPGVYIYKVTANDHRQGSGKLIIKSP